MEKNRLSAPSEHQPALYVVRKKGEVPDLGNEISHWFNPLNFYVYLWQPNRLRYYFHTRNHFFRFALQLPHFPRLWENIVKGSFAYNVFLFKKPAFGRHAANSFIADLACLALLFGDEFIDGLCEELGKCHVQELLVVNNERFYLQIKSGGNSHPLLAYSFNLYELLPAEIWEKKNEKYKITYRCFYELLKDLLELINNRMGKISPQIAWPAATKFTECCNHCFDTYIHDITEVPVQLQQENARPATFFHEKKNNEIQTLLLELRCILLNKKISRYARLFDGWLNIISTMQVYDDMQDCRLDECFQDNLLLEIATKNFPVELHWFHCNKTRFLDDEEWRLQVSLHMPCSVYLCKEFCRGKIMDTMQWTQKKICNYLWQKNWFVPVKNKINHHGDTACKNYLPDRLGDMMQKTKSIFNLTGSEEEWKAYVLETAFHDRQLKRFLFSKIQWVDIYFLRFNFLQMSRERKARMMDKVLSRNFSA